MGLCLRRSSGPGPSRAAHTASSGLIPVLAAYSKWIEGHYRDRRGLSGFSYDLGVDAPVPNLPVTATLPLHE